MSAEIATLERVKAAIAGLRQTDEKVTADRIIQRLGGGSKPTVLKHMKTLRNEDVPQDPVPAVVFDMARTALADIYAAGAKAESERNRSQMERMTRVMDELDIQIEELAHENTRLTVQAGQLQSERDAAINRGEALDEELRATRADLNAARSELANERAAASVRLSEMIARFEASLSTIGTKTARARTK